MKTSSAAESCGAVCSSDTPSSSFSSFSSSHISKAQKAKLLDAHIPSLKRRRLGECDYEGRVSEKLETSYGCCLLPDVWSLRSDEHGGASGMAKICVEYECEVQESQRRPANLLDALERGARRSGEEDGAAVGEEKVACFLSSTFLSLSLCDYL